MSSKVYKESTNPFEGDVANNSRRLKSPFQDQIQSLQDRRKEMEHLTIQSTKRSISMIRDSEQIGVATADELMRQRDQLERTDKSLDEINTTLKVSQRHINSTKSVFGGLKNFVSGKTKKAHSNNAPPITTLNKSRSKNNFQDSSQNYDRSDNHSTTKSNQASDSENVNSMLDNNLEVMSISVNRLKVLAVEISGEIGGQNELIDNMIEKTVSADITIQHQNKDIVGLLIKK